MLTAIADAIVPPVALSAVYVVERAARAVPFLQGLRSLARIVVAHYQEKLYNATLHRALIAALAERDRAQRDLKHANATLRRRDSDVVMQFINDCARSPRDSELYQRFCAWQSARVPRA